MGLEPVVIAQDFANKDFAALKARCVDLCVACGSCTYACPAKRPVSQTMAFARAGTWPSCGKEANNPWKIVLIVTASPHIRDASTTRGLMGNVVIALLPAVLAAGLDLRHAGAGAGRCDHPWPVWRLSTFMKSC